MRAFPITKCPLTVVPLALLVCAAVCMPQPAAGGILYAWGRDWGGLLDVPSGNDYVEVEARGYYSVAIRADRTLVAWGTDYYQTISPLPGGTFAQVSCNDEHALGLRTDGSLVAWGTENYGRTIVPAGDHYAAVAAGWQYSVALQSNGTIVAWGLGSNGQLNVPAGSDFVAIAAGRSHTLALRNDGSLAAWGWNNHGQTTVPAGDDYVAITAGDWHSVALKADGSIVTWGTPYYTVPPPTGDDFVAVTAGNEHTLALRSDGSVAAWGENSYGKATAPAGNNFLDVAGADDHSVAIRFSPGWMSHGTATCTGDMDGFATGGYTTVGMETGAVTMPFTVDVTGLALEDGFAALNVYYDAGEAAALGIDEATLRLYWWDAGASQWALAGNPSNLTDNNGDPGYTGFVMGLPTGVLGDWGINVDEDYIWANIDHASPYALAGIPEPATIVLLVSGGVLALLRLRRREVRRQC